MAYRTTRLVGCHRRQYEEKSPISFDEKDPADVVARDSLLACGAIVKTSGKDQAETGSGGKAEKPASAGEGGQSGQAPAAPKPLAEQSLEELQATAKTEKVPGWGPVKGDFSKLLARIEAHRAATAAKA